MLVDCGSIGMVGVRCSRTTREKRWTIGRVVIDYDELF